MEGRNREGSTIRHNCGGLRGSDSFKTGKEVVDQEGSIGTPTLKDVSRRGLERWVV